DQNVRMSDARRPRVFVSRQIPAAGLERLGAECDLEVWPDELPPGRAELLEAVAGCDGILTLLTDRVDDELLDAAGGRRPGGGHYSLSVETPDREGGAR